MTQVNNNPPQVLSAQLVNNNEVKEARKNAVASAQTDGKHNVVLVEDIGNDESVVSNISVEDIQNFKVGQEATIGTATGRVVFIDDASDDATQKPSITVEKGQSQPVQSTPVKEVKKNTSPFALSTENAYKFGTVYQEAHTRYIARSSGKESINAARQEKLNPREHREKTQDLQSWVNSENPQEKKIGTDGTFGEKSFLAFKLHYQNHAATGSDKYVSDQEFKSLVDDAIKVFDQKMPAIDFAKKWHFDL